MTKFLTVEDVQNIHTALGQMFEHEGDPIEPPGVKDAGLLESAVNRPATSLGGFEKYKTKHEKTAALFHSLILNHPFHNGNKRTALLSAITFLEKNERSVTADEEDLFLLTVQVANHSLPIAGSGSDSEVDYLSSWWRQNSATRPEPQDMRVQDFLQRCREMDVHVKEDSKGARYILRGSRGQSINIDIKAPELHRQALKRYLQKLGITKDHTGVDLYDFVHGHRPDQNIHVRFRNVLKRLNDYDKN